MGSKGEYLVSIRSKFTPENAGWTDHLQFLGLTHLHEIRTIDPNLNPVVEGEAVVNSLEEVLGYSEFKEPNASTEYCLLHARVTDEVLAIRDPRLNPLGYDLSDETGTSSVVNCGQWVGVLQAIAARSKVNGLLEIHDARLAQQLLPEAWNGDPHAYVQIWALFEVSLKSFRRHDVSRDSWALKSNLFPFT